MTTTSVRIPTWRIHAANLRNAIFGPDHNGATTTWLDDLRNTPVTSHPGATDTAIIPIRRPIAALTATGHYERYDDLGGWNPSQSELEPAYIHDQLVNTVNTGALR